MANSRVCSIPDCGNKHLAQGLCNKHYKRLREHGDSSKTKSTPKGDLQKFYEEVILNYDGDECLIWPFSRAKGYGQINRGGKHVVVSRLVCEDINGPPPTPEHEAAHSCGRGNEGCVTKGHLSWKTHAENQADRILHGTHNRGERSSQAKLTEKQVREIISLKGIETIASLASRYGVSGPTVFLIQIGKSWSWIGSEHSLPIANQSGFS